MNRPQNYTETSQFIHQRYEDTSYVIFQQQQRKKELPRFRFKPPQDSASSSGQDLARFGNPTGIRVKQDAAATNTVRDTHTNRSAVCTIM